MLDLQTTLVILAVAGALAALFAFFHYVIWSPLPRQRIKWVVLEVFILIIVIGYFAEVSHSVGQSVSLW